MTQEQMQRAADAISGIYQDLEELLMRNIIRHIEGYEQPIASDTWLLQRLAEIGRLNQENIQTIASHAGLSRTAAERMLEDMAEDAMDSMEPAMRHALREGYLEKAAVSVGKSKNVKQVMKALRSQAKDTLNLCNTTMLYKARDAYVKLAHKAAAALKDVTDKQEYLDVMNKHGAAVVTGVEARQQAVRSCIKEFADKGIPAFVDKKGREWTPEAYVNMAMRNTAKQVAVETQNARCKDYGVRLIEIDSHSGARPKCAKDQGKIFSLDNDSGETEDLYGKKVKYYPWNSSSYGEPDGILGINCRHRQWPFVPGISLQRYFPTEDMAANDKLYKETQMQRALERDVRKQKRECMLLDEAGDQEGFEEAAVKLKQKEARLREYVNSNDQLHRRKDREQVVGFDKRISSNAVAADRNRYNQFAEKVGKKNAPSFTKYSQSGYNKTEEYRDLKALAEYRDKVPDADMEHYKLNCYIRDNKLARGNVVPVAKHRAYILEDKANKKDPAHIMKRMRERNITDDQVQYNVDNAVICISQYQGTRLLYYSPEGATVLTKTTDYGDIKWIAKTAWSKYDYDEKSEAILKEALKYV